MLTCCSLMLLAACAANKAGNAQPGDYVEVPNPAITMDPNATPTIWVPRRYVESGLPRGGELIKKGYEQVKGTPQAAPQAPGQVMAAQQPPTKPVPQPAVAPIPLKSRIAVLETGENRL